MKDDTTIIISLITGNDELYREEIETLTSLCKDNKLHLNVCRTKVLVLDFRKIQRTHISVYIYETQGEKVFRSISMRTEMDNP